MKKLAIISTHPIQYNAPFFSLLAQRNKLEVKVFYTWSQVEYEEKFDPGFGKKVAWDIPLLEGYEYTFVKNISKDPGSHHFKGIDNPSLVSEVENWAPDAVLIFGWSFKSHLKALRYFKGKAMILFRGDSTLIDEVKGLSFKKIIRRILLKWVYRHVDIALYVGSANKRYYLKYGLKNSQLVFAPHAVDNKRFKKQDTNSERERLNISQREVVFLFCGKFEIKKDPFLLLDCFIAMNNPETHLLMTGNGLLEAQLKLKVSEQTEAIRNRIHFLPFQNQLRIPAIYKTADIFVLPSGGPGETWGLSVNEAMSCGRAVLVSNKCGCSADLVQEGLNGYIFKNKDKADLLNKMTMLVMQRERLVDMGKKSLQIIESWNYEKICAAVEDAIITA